MEILLSILIQKYQGKDLRKKIIQSLQKTEEIVKIKRLTEMVLSLRFEEISDVAMENLLLDISGDLSRTQLSLMIEQQRVFEDKIKSLTNENIRLKKSVKLTENEIVEVPDEDINYLYLQYAENKDNSSHNEAFVMELNTGKTIIPKSYYVI